MCYAIEAGSTIGAIAEDREQSRSGRTLDPRWALGAICSVCSVRSIRCWAGSEAGDHHHKSISSLATGA
jgi:hypothetical protein